MVARIDILPYHIIGCFNSNAGNVPEQNGKEIKLLIGCIPWFAFSGLQMNHNISLFLGNFQVWILCNDCGMESNVHFHVLAHKCPGCNSYNTRQTRGGPAACVRDVRE